MKRATIRPNVQTGENANHATYRNWKMSVIDYALWQASTGLWKIKSEEQYFAYLAEHYAESPTYATHVKSIRDKFDFYLDLYENKFKNKK
jgi:flagellum-specific peptidoglycan hydrolase FlgJ